jgi:hypothetical protein
VATTLGTGLSLHYSVCRPHSNGFIHPTIVTHVKRYYFTIYYTKTTQLPLENLRLRNAITSYQFLHCCQRTELLCLLPVRYNRHNSAIRSETVPNTRWLCLFLGTPQFLPCFPFVLEKAGLLESSAVCACVLVHARMHAHTSTLVAGDWDRTTALILKSPSGSSLALF